jgi:hypothetical protein
MFLDGNIVGEFECATVYCMGALSGETVSSYGNIIAINGRYILLVTAMLLSGILKQHFGSFVVEDEYI